MLSITKYFLRPKQPALHNVRGEAPHHEQQQALRALPVGPWLHASQVVRNCIGVVRSENGSLVGMVELFFEVFGGKLIPLVL